MIINHRSRGVEKLSSDSDDSILEINTLKRRKRNIIEIPSSDDSDVEMTHFQLNKPRVNEVWRNIIECDILDQRINSIGFNFNRVERDIESYDLPSYKCRKRKYFSYKNRKRKDLKNNYCIKKPCFSSEEDDIKILDKKTKPVKPECIVLNDSDDDYNSICVISDDSERYDTNHSSSEESSDSDCNDTNPTSLSLVSNNSWNKLVDKVNNFENDEFQVEFEAGRKKTAIKIANKLNEPKIDLIDRCLFYLGLKKCKIFLEAVLEIEDSGGMPTIDGSRRRTPGGVFFTLIKSDRNVDKEIKKLIFNTNEPAVQDESLWWRSLEILQYRNNPRSMNSTTNFARRKEFKSYTLVDLDFFQSIRDFEYRYIPIMSNFPLADERHPFEISSDEDDGNDNDFMRITDSIEPFCAANL